MSTLQQAARDALASFRNTALTSLRNASTDVDIYRTLRDVSSLLYETQIVRDMFDSDPFGLSWRMNDGDDEAEEEAKGGEGEEENDNEDKNNESNDADECNEKKNNRILSQIQNMLQVTSCHRTTTPHGHSSIYAIVQFNINDNDGATDDNTLVKHNIRMRFNFVREPNIAFDLATITSLQEQQFQYSSTADVDTEINDNDEEEEEEKDDDEEEEVLTNRITPEQKQQQHPLPASKKRKIMTNDNDEEDDDEDIDDSSGSAQSTIPPPQQQQQQQQSSLPQQKYKTQISYKIDYSIDYGKFESLLGIDIYAINNYPSISPAICIIDNYNDENYDDDEDEGDGCADGCCCTGMANDLFLPPNLKNINNSNSSNKSSNNNDNAEEDVEMSNSDVVHDEEEDDNEDEEDGSSNYITTETDTAANPADRYGVSIHLQNIVTFLDCTKNINLTESSIFYFLLTFPYYEHEWDIAGLILSSIYDDDVDDDDDNEAEEAV
jgi:flagellar biosynthesis regulator FlbT